MASKKAAENDEGVVFIFPADDAKKSLLETGAYVRDDASAGHRIDDFINIKEFPLRKVEGLDFCAQNSFYDEVCYFMGSIGIWQILIHFRPCAM